MPKSLALHVALAVAFPCVAFAADFGQPSIDRPAIEGMGQFNGMTVNEVIGLAVLGSEGRYVGEVDAVFIDDGCYRAVIGMGGFLGLGQHSVVLPLSDFDMAAGELHHTDATKDDLRSLPEVDDGDIDGLGGYYIIG